MNLRDNILIQLNAIAPSALRSIMEYVSQASMSDSLVSDAEDAEAAEAKWIINKNVRDTQEVHLTDAMRRTLSAIDDTNIREFINPFYQVEVGDREPSQILHYGTGGHYIAHVDAETLFKDDDGLELWEKTLDRDLSVVYFLNDDFVGGELVFSEIELVIKPQAGTLVCFPSDHHYIHGVNPVTAGHRHTLVTWMRVKGMPTPEEINERVLNEYHRSWPAQIEQPSRLAKGGISTQRQK